MFIGMSFCLPIGWAFDYFQRQKKPESSDTEPLLEHDQASLEACVQCNSNFMSGIEACIWLHRVAESCSSRLINHEVIIANLNPNSTVLTTWCLQTAQTASGDHSTHHSNLRNTLLLAIPTAFDLTATILMSVGLLFVTASVYQVISS